MADGYNPGASMLQTNQDAILKVFMGGGGAGADGGAGMAYNDTQTLLQRVQGAHLERFDGGAMMVPTADGQKRLLQDVLNVPSVVKYDQKNNIIRSLEDLRAAFESDATYNEFIDWLGSKLLDNEQFKTFVKERMITISAAPTKIRAKRRTRAEMISAELQKSIENIKKTQDELARLQEVKQKVDKQIKDMVDSGKSEEELKAIKAGKLRTEKEIAKQQQQLTAAIATSTAIPKMSDEQLAARDASTGVVPAEGKVEEAKAVVLPEPTAPQAAVVPTAPLETEVAAAEAAKKAAEEAAAKEAATSATSIVNINPNSVVPQGASTAAPQATATVVPPPENPAASPTGSTETVVPPPEIPTGTQGGARKAPRRTLKRRSNKARKASLKKYK
jgi:hypothetical protein